MSHKRVGKLFIASGLACLAFGGALALLIRWQWAFPQAMTAQTYQTLFTMHGLVMIFWAITPILISGFGNLMLPELVGAERPAFKNLGTVSFGFFAVSVALWVMSYFVPLGTASAGWTTYPPLATKVGTPGVGQTLVVAAMLCVAVSTLLSAVNFVTTVVSARTLPWLRLPLSAWGYFFASVLNVLFIPVLAVGTLLLLCDRLFGTDFFVAGASGQGDPILFQHLFWLFGHPEVYILILPVWGLISELLAVFGRREPYAYRVTVAALTAITVLSCLVYGHHLFVAGLKPLLGRTFMFFTVAISAPSMVLFMNWLGTLWGTKPSFDSPMLFALGAMFVFGTGGITGLHLASVTTDLYLHDTMYVVGHFHLTMAAAVFLGSLAALHYWFPQLFNGRRLDERWAKAHFAFTLVLLCVVFGGQLLAGYSGQQRRLADPYQYDYLKRLLPLNRATSYAAFALGAAQLILVVNFFKSLFRPSGGSTEWPVGSPRPLDSARGERDRKAPG